MKYLKSYKLFESVTYEDVEDVLLPFIDDKLCKVEGGEHFKEFKFTSEEDLNKAEERLKRFNITDFKTNYLNIVWYSKEIEDFFLKFLLDDYEKVKGKYLDLVWKKNGVGYFGQDLKNHQFYIDYERIWSIFLSKYSMNYQQIQAFTKILVEEHTKMKGITTYQKGWHYPYW